MIRCKRPDTRPSIRRAECFEIDARQAEEIVIGHELSFIINESAELARNDNEDRG